MSVNTFISSPCIKDYFRPNTNWKTALKSNYLPEQAQEGQPQIPDLASVQLVYLALMSATTGSQPFTKNQLRKFKKSDQANCLALCGLSTGLVASSLAVTGLSLISLVPNDSPSWVKGIVLLAAIVANVFVVLFSYWSTGFAPNTSSNRFNDKQDTLIALQKTYDRQALQLIELFYNLAMPKRKFAQAIANQINMDTIQVKLIRAIHDPERAVVMLNSLKEAQRLIQSDTSDEEPIWPEDPFLRLAAKTVRRHYVQEQ